MFTLQINTITIKRYKCQWYSFSGKRRYVIKTRILHADSLIDAQNKAIKLYGNKPDNILRV